MTHRQCSSAVDNVDCPMSVVLPFGRLLVGLRLRSGFAAPGVALHGAGGRVCTGPCMNRECSICCEVVKSQRHTESEMAN